MTCFHFILTVALRFALPSEGSLSSMRREEARCASSDCQYCQEGIPSCVPFPAGEVTAAPEVVMVQYFVTKSTVSVSNEETDHNISACDWQCYLNSYPDISDAIGTTNTAGAEHHFQSYGKSEGRDCTCSVVCDWQCYLNRNPDVSEMLGWTNTAGAELHFQSYGKSEGRDCTCSVTRMASVSPPQVRKAMKASRTDTVSLPPKREAIKEIDAVAILTSGTSSRYFLHDAVEHFIGPMVKEGYRVDYYLALNTQTFDSFNGVANLFVGDPLFKQSTPDVVAKINSSVSKVGGYLQSIRLEDMVELDASDESDIKSSRWYATMTVKRNKALENWVRKSKLLAALWSDVEKAEKDFGRYKTVIIIDDDACWFGEFSLARVLSASALHDEKYVLTLQCGDGSTYPTSEGTLCDYMQILGREAAPMFVKQRSSMQRYRNERNGESLLWKLALDNGLASPRVSSRLIPMQRCGKMRDGSRCLHKVCNSDGEGPTSTLPTCDSVLDN